MFKTLYELATHKYIRSGESLTTYYGNDSKAYGITKNVKVEGWGKYAAVKLNTGYIRRDLIKKDENGNWFYRYEP